MRQATPSLGLLALFPLFTVSHWISRSCLFWSLSDLKLRTAIQHLFPPRRRTVLYLILFSHCFYLRPALAPGDCLFSYPIIAPRRILENVVQYEIWLLIGFQEVSARYHSVLTEGDRTLTVETEKQEASFMIFFFSFTVATEYDILYSLASWFEWGRTPSKPWMGGKWKKHWLYIACVKKREKNIVWETAKVLSEIGLFKRIIRLLTCYTFELILPLFFKDISKVLTVRLLNCALY